MNLGGSPFAARIRGLARDSRLLGRSAHRSVPVAHGRRWPCPSASMATESAARCATFGGLTPGCGKRSRRARPQPARNLARRAWWVACPHGHSRRPRVDGSKQEVPMPVAAANRYRRRLPRLYWEGKGNALGSRRQPAASREPVPWSASRSQAFRLRSNPVHATEPRPLPGLRQRFVYASVQRKRPVARHWHRVPDGRMHRLRVVPAGSPAKRPATQGIPARIVLVGGCSAS